MLQKGGDVNAPKEQRAWHGVACNLSSKSMSCHVLLRKVAIKKGGLQSKKESRNSQVAQEMHQATLTSVVLEK